MPSTVTVSRVKDGAKSGVDAIAEFSRTGATTDPLTVYYTITGTATADTNFVALPGQVTIAAGHSTAQVHAVPIEDDLADSGFTVILTVIDDGMNGYDIASPSGITTLKLIDSTAATFTLNSVAGSIRYDVPWSSVDPAQATQSLSLSNFAITVAGETLTPANSSFTTSPTAQFAYGVFTGVTFAIDTSSQMGYAYSSVSMSGFTISGIDAITTVTVNASAVNYGSGTLSFTNATNNVAIWKAEITLTYIDDDFNVTSFTYAQVFNNNTTATAMALAFQAELTADGVATIRDGDLLVIKGVDGEHLVSIEYKTYTWNATTSQWVYANGLNSPVKMAQATITTVSINP